jgi:hypothetical protein
MDYGLWIMDYGLWIMDYGHENKGWIMDYGHENKGWIMDYGLWIMVMRIKDRLWIIIFSNIYYMKLGHIVHDIHNVLEVTSHVGGAIGNASSTILDAGNAISDFKHHDIVGGIIESGETIYHGVETYGDIVSGDYF